MSPGRPQPRPRSAYLGQVARIAPPEPGLIGREAELAELARFCLDPGSGPYAWWQAGPWAGKSALLSTFVLRPPPEVANRVQFVSFFITARLAAQDTRETFTQVMADQLADMLGQSLPPALPEATREAYLLNLMSEAAVACQDAGGRLVLVVDGLDEDRGITTGPDVHSIAGLLPADPPAGMRVIVAGRPNPPVPDDVPDRHPLRDPAIIRPLPDSPHARDVRRLGRQELQRLLGGSPAEQHVLGLLTAARGGLSAWDLAELVGIGRWEVARILRAAAGRTLQCRPSPLDSTGRPELYLLGHEELQAAAVDYLGDRLPSYHDRLHAWADGYCARGWPAETPEYLVSGYFWLLHDLGDLSRMIECALDAARHARMLDLTGGDAAALAETRTTLDGIAAADGPDLASALALACHRDHLADQAASIPENLPAVWAVLGQVARARALAASLSLPDAQARALAQVAGALARAKRHQEAGDIAAEAADITRTITNPIWRANALVDVAGALADAGQHQDAEALARSLTEPSWRASALADVAVALANSGQQQEAEALARSITDPDWQAGTVALVADALARAGEHEQAEALARSISDPGWQASALARIAVALAAAGQHHYAEAIAVQAEATAGDITQLDSRASVLARIAVALAKAGQHQRAEAIAVQVADITCSIANSYFQANTAGGAPVGDSAWSTNEPDLPAGDLARIAGMLAEAGQRPLAAVITELAENIACSITDLGSRARALARVAGELAEAGQHQQATAIAAQAEDVARSIAGLDSQGLELASVAGSLADAGQYQQAADFARSIADPDWQVIALDWAADALARIGQYQHAEELARSIADPERQMMALSSVARELAKAGQHLRAEDIARSLADPEWQARILAPTATELARAGLHQRAITIAGQAESLARSLADSYAREMILAEVVEALARAGQLRRAEDVARSLTGQGAQASGLSRVAGALARAGQLRRAEDVARSLTEPSARARVLTRVVAELAEAGQHRQAKAIAARAQDAACSVFRQDSQVSLLREVADGLARAGLQEDATAIAARAALIARSVSDSHGRAGALVDVTAMLAGAGQYQDAEVLARSITSPFDQGHALAKVAVAMARAGATGPARRVAAAACAAGKWTIAADPVLLLEPSAFATLARTMGAWQLPGGASGDTPPASPGMPKPS